MSQSNRRTIDVGSFERREKIRKYRNSAGGLCGRFFFRQDLRLCRYRGILCERQRKGKFAALASTLTEGSASFALPVGSDISGCVSVAVSARAGATTISSTTDA